MPEKSPVIVVIIPAFNEEQAIGKVIDEIPRSLVREIVVCDNGSTDGTAQVAKHRSATVVQEPKRGYGYACLAGIAYLHEKADDIQPDIVVFLDGDYADFPGQMDRLVRPIVMDNMDLVIGSRTLGITQRNALTHPQRFGNWLSTLLIRWLYGYRFTDLGPFRAVKWDVLLSLNMQDPTYGWTVEMQVKAARQHRRCTEVPVDYRKRVGKSKVSGTVKGTVLAGYKILWIIFKFL